MILTLSALFVSLGLQSIVIGQFTAGLDYKVWKCILEETDKDVKGQYKSIGTIYTIFLWPEFTKWMPFNIIIPTIELDVEEKNQAKGYISSEEGTMSTSIEFRTYQKSDADELKITFKGRFTMMYLEFKLCGKGFTFKENEEVTANVWFQESAWFEMETEVRDLFTEDNPSPVCLLTIHDVAVTQLPSTFLEKWAGWTPGVRQSDAESIYSLFIDNVSEDVFKGVIRLGLMRAMKNQEDREGVKWVCLSEKFKETVKSDEHVWKHSVDYSQYCG